MKRYVLAMVLLSAMGGAAYVLLRDPAPTAPAPVVRGASNPPAVAGAARSAAPAARPASKTEEAPAWMSPPSGPSAARADTGDGAASAAQDAKTARIEKIMEKFQRLQADANPQPREIAAAIGELESANGSPVLNGVRLDVLRHNVLVAEKMQKASDDMRKLQGAPDATSPQNLALVQARIAELETLRGQLRADVMEPKAQGTQGTLGATP